MNDEGWLWLLGIVALVCVTAGVIAYIVTADDYTRCTWRQDEQECARLYMGAK